MIDILKGRKVFIVLYAFMIFSICVTSYISPILASHFKLNVFLSSLMIFGTSLYLFDFKHLKRWFRQQWFLAETRGRERKQLENELERRMKGQ